MTPTHKLHARFLTTTAALTGIALLTVGCGSSTPKAKTASTTETTVTTAAAAKDPNDSDYCKEARQWMVHEFNGDGDTLSSDPVAFKKYWGEWMAHIKTATQLAPEEIREDWPISHDFETKQVTAALQKFNFDVERLKSEGSPADLAVAKKVEEGPNPTEERSQDAIHEYEGSVCQTSQPPPADVSFAGAKVNQAYCDAVQAGDELVQKHVIDTKWSVDGVRAFVTSDEFAAGAAKAKANAPAEIKADVIADVDWQLNQQKDVIEKYGYDARKLFLEGTAADRAIFQRSDPAIAEHYARTIAYEEQLCEG